MAHSSGESFDPEREFLVALLSMLLLAIIGRFYRLLHPGVFVPRIPWTGFFCILGRIAVDRSSLLFGDHVFSFSKSRR